MGSLVNYAAAGGAWYYLNNGIVPVSDGMSAALGVGVAYVLAQRPNPEDTTPFTGMLDSVTAIVGAAASKWIMNKASPQYAIPVAQLTLAVGLYMKYKNKGQVVA
jgi:hypothetical protein